MARYATVDDVAVRLGRELTPAERTRAAALLDDAETVIRTRVPDLDDRVTGGRLAAEVVRLVVVAVVVRMLRNPGGYRSETAGDYSYQVDARAASGVLDLLPVEWRWLGLDVGAWSITPHARPAAWPWWARHRDRWTWGPSPDGWPVDPP